MSVRQMQRELEQWGKWAGSSERTCGVKQYVCPTYTMLRLAVGESRKSGVQIVLDDAALIAVDQLVTALRLSRPDLYQWVAAHYLKGCPVAALAGMTKVARYKIDGYLLAAESWLDSRLEVMCERAA
ncbi:MAG: antiterminator Q family protein [Pseudomonadota bacterium]|nr:antiterminator Q family protein [Pseudomonadota bacterium]